MPGTSSPETISTRLQRIVELAQEAQDRVLTTLHHRLGLDWLGEAYRRTRKDGAVGVDGQTAESYAADLEGNLRSLLDRFKSGSYRAQAVRRVHIPKGDGRKTRPIGVPKPRSLSTASGSRPRRVAPGPENAAEPGNRRQSVERVLARGAENSGKISCRPVAGLRQGARHRRTKGSPPGGGALTCRTE